MNLIIDIPKGRLNSIKMFGIKQNEVCMLERALISGTPLDDVKAEIEKNCDRINSIASVLSYSQHREIQELLCEILDNIGKAESEE